MSIGEGLLKPEQVNSCAKSLRPQQLVQAKPSTQSLHVQALACRAARSDVSVVVSCTLFQPVSLNKVSCCRRMVASACLRHLGANAKACTQADRTTMLPRQTRSMAAGGMRPAAHKSQEVGHLPRQPALRPAAEPLCNVNNSLVTAFRWSLQEDKDVIKLRSGRAVPKVGLRYNITQWQRFSRNAVASDGALLPAARAEASSQDDCCSSGQGCSSR